MLRLFRLALRKTVPRPGAGKGGQPGREADLGAGDDLVHRVLEPLEQRPQHVGLAVGEDQGELVAADASGHVAGPQRVAQLDADRPQGGVAGGVPQPVVELLEAVEVEDHQRERPPVPLATRHRLPQLGLV